MGQQTSVHTVGTRTNKTGKEVRKSRNEGLKTWTQVTMLWIKFNTYLVPTICYHKVGLYIHQKAILISHKLSNFWF